MTAACMGQVFLHTSVHVYTLIIISSYTMQWSTSVLYLITCGYCLAIGNKRTIIQLKFAPVLNSFFCN